MAARVIVLNGGSSSGTTSVARALQARLPEPHLLLGVDTLIDAMPAGGSHDAPIAVDADGTVGPPGRCAPSNGVVPRAGRDGAQRVPLIVDEVFLEGARSRARISPAVRGLTVWWVGVHCDAAVAAAREATRPDRDPGMAAAQARTVHVGIEYDIEVDTTDRTAEACAEVVAAVLDAAG